MLSERGKQLRRSFEVPILISALFVVPVVLIEEQADSDALLTAAYWVNWAIWSAFLLEHLVVSRHASSRWGYAKQDWLNVVIIAVSFPLLPHILAGLRLVRLGRLAPALRVLRLIRLAVIVSRGGVAARVILGRRHLAFVTILTLLIAMAFGAAFSLVEGTGTTVDGIWWAIVTLTSVGYGDVTPTTGAGRIVAGLLMVLGIAYIAYLTAVVASHFVQRDIADDLEKDNIQMSRIEERLIRIEELIGASTPPSHEEIESSLSDREAVP